MRLDRHSNQSGIIDRQASHLVPDVEADPCIAPGCVRLDASDSEALHVDHLRCECGEAEFLPGRERRDHVIHDHRAAVVALEPSDCLHASFSRGGVQDQFNGPRLIPWVPGCFDAVAAGRPAGSQQVNLLRRSPENLGRAPKTSPAPPEIVPPGGRHQSPSADLMSSTVTAVEIPPPPPIGPAKTGPRGRVQYPCSWPSARARCSRTRPPRCAFAASRSMRADHT